MAQVTPPARSRCLLGPGIAVSGTPRPDGHFFARGNAGNLQNPIPAISRVSMARRPSPKRRGQAPAKRAAKPAKRATRAKAARAKPAAVAAKRGKWVYAFGGGKAEGKAGMRDLLGGKGA